MHWTLVLILAWGIQLLALVLAAIFIFFERQR